jgi:hypothetical protein
MFSSICRNAHDSGIESEAARSIQLNAVFDSDSEFLLWLAEVIHRRPEGCRGTPGRRAEGQSATVYSWTGCLSGPARQPSNRRYNTPTVRYCLPPTTTIRFVAPTVDMFLFPRSNFENCNRFLPRSCLRTVSWESFAESLTACSRTVRFAWEQHAPLLQPRAACSINGLSSTSRRLCVTSLCITARR